MLKAVKREPKKTGAAGWGESEKWEIVSYLSVLFPVFLLAAFLRQFRYVVIAGLELAI